MQLLGHATVLGTAEPRVQRRLSGQEKGQQFLFLQRRFLWNRDGSVRPAPRRNVDNPGTVPRC